MGRHFHDSGFLDENTLSPSLEVEALAYFDNTEEAV